MANYDIVETLDIPVFIGHGATAADANMWEYDDLGRVIMKSPPYTTVKVNVYEYSGSVDDFDFYSVHYFENLESLNIIRRTNNVTLPGEYEQIVLFFADNYSIYTEEPRNGYMCVLEGIKTADPNYIAYYAWGKGTGFSAYLDHLFYSVFIRDLTGVYYMVVGEAPFGTYFLIPLVGTTIQNTVTDPVNYTAQTNYPIYQLVLTNPKSRYFEVNQSSTLEFALRDSDGSEISADAEVETVGIVPSNWSFNSSTKRLTLLSSTSPMAINIKATYETSDKTYSSTFTFLVRVNNPYTGGGISQPNGGAGSYENGTFGDPSTSDDITADLQDGSTFGNASSSGTFTRYLVNNRYLEIFGDWLWNTSLGLAIAQEVIRFIYGDPSESIISLMSYPFQLTGLEGVSHELRDFYWGNHNAGYQVPALLTTAGQFNWGTLTFDEYWGNFLDYSPYTRVQLYLPWGTGFVDVNPDEILPGTLSIKTVVEFDKGSCVHILSNQQGAVIGTYSGQCGKQIALMASDFSSKLARIAVMGAVAGGIAVGSAATGAMATASNIASGNFGFRTGVKGAGVGMTAPMLNEGVMMENVSSAVHPPLKIPKGSLATKKHPINISRSGAFTDGSAGLGVQFPYVILSRPTQSVPEEYGAYEGYPSNIYADLSELKGYTEVGEIHLAGFENITVDELNKLDELLKGGVIF